MLQYKGHRWKIEEKMGRKYASGQRLASVKKARPQNPSFGKSSQLVLQFVILLVIRIKARRRSSVTPRAVIVASLMLAAMLQPTRIFSQDLQDPEDPQDLPVYLRDRGTGIPMSIFGTYVRKGELLVYPFYEYIKDDNLEYEPADFGFPLKREFRGRFRGHETLIFIGYGISDRLAIEFEAGVITAKFNKSGSDTTAAGRNRRIRPERCGRTNQVAMEP